MCTLLIRINQPYIKKDRTLSKNKHNLCFVHENLTHRYREQQDLQLTNYLFNPIIKYLLHFWFVDCSYSFCDYWKLFLWIINNFSCFIWILFYVANVKLKSLCNCLKQWLKGNLVHQLNMSKVMDEVTFNFSLLIGNFWVLFIA